MDNTGALMMTEAIVAPRLSQDAFTRILDVTRKLAEPYELVSILSEIVQAGESVLTADRAAVWLYRPDREDLIMRVPVLSPAPRLEVGQGLVGECLAQREVINVKDVRNDPRYHSSLDLVLDYKTQSELAVPLLGREQEPVGVLQLLNKHDGVFDSNDERVAATLAAQCAVAVQRTQLTEALILKERLDEEVTLAREIQMSTLPTEMPGVAGYDLHGHFQPTDHTGGDMFDLVMVGEQLFILMGDATGHGFGPALSATQMQAMLRVAFRCGVSLDEAFKHVNNQLAEDLPEDRFLTAFMGFLNPSTHRVRYFSGGQGPILHFRAEDESCEWHAPTTFPVGILEIEDAGDAGLISMAPGDVLALLSDGIYEYENRQGLQFGEEKVEQLMSYHHRLPMSELSRQIMLAIIEHGRAVPQADDITLVLLKRLPD
jgi:phosphoserine phosphatase